MTGSSKVSSLSRESKYVAHKESKQRVSICDRKDKNYDTFVALSTDAHSTENVKEL